MAKAVQLPDGSYFPVNEGEDYATAMQAAYAKYPEAFGRQKEGPEPEGGFIAALKSGASKLKGDVAALAGRSGAIDVATAEKIRADEEAYQKKTFKPTEEGFTGAPFTKIKELLGGSLPYMAAPLAAGAAAATLPLTGTAATIAGLGAAGLASATQFAGSNLSRQIEEGKGLAETDLTSAALTAIPQALLDTVAMRMIPGVRGLLGSAGKPITAATAKEVAEQGLKKTIADYAVNTGKVMGTEGLTEAAQQVFERLQAGLNLTDAKAQQEYFDSFIGGAVLGGVVSPAGRYVERGNEQSAARKVLRDQQTEANLAQKAQQDAAAAQLEIDKQTPAYAKQAEQAYFAAEKNKADLLAQIIKGTKDKPLTEVDKQANTETAKKLKENAAVLTEAAKEYRQVKPLLDQIKAQEDLVETKRLQAIETERLQAEEIAARPPQATLPGIDAVEQTPFSFTNAPVPDVDNQAQITDFATKQQEVRRLLEYNQTAASDAASDADTAAIKQLSGERKKLQTELDYVTNKLADLGGVQSPENIAAQTQQKLDAAKKKLKAMAGEGFDPVKADRLVAQIDALEEEIKSYGIPKNTPTVQRSITEPGYIEGLRTQQRAIDKDEADAATSLLAGQKTTVSKDPLALLRQSNEDLANANIATTAAEREAQKPFRSAEPGTLAEADILRASNVGVSQEALPETEPETLADIPAVEQLVATLPQAATVTPGQIQQGLGVSPQRALNDLQAKFQIARLTGNKEAQTALIADLQDARKQDTAARGATTTGLQSALGFGTLAEGRATEANAEMHADKQNKVLLDVVKILNTLRFNRIPGTLTLDPEKGIKTQFDKAKEAYAAAHAAEINERRKAFGIPEMATWEAADARARVMEGFNELQDRWNVFESRHAAALAIQEQMRNNITDNLQKAAARLLPKQTAELQEKTIAPTGGKRIVPPATLELKGTPYRANNEKQDALNLIEAVLSTVKTRTRAVPTTEKIAAEKVGSLQDIAQLFAAEKSGGVSARTDPATQALLEQLAEALPKISDPDIITLARQQAQQVLEGNLPSPNAVLELQAAIKFQEKEGASGTQPGATLADLQRTSAQPQLELFDEPAFGREFSGFLKNMGLDEAEYKKLSTTGKSQIKEMFTASGTRTTPFQTVRRLPETFHGMLDSKKVAALKDKIKKTNGALKKQTQDVQNALSTAITKHNRALEKAKAAKETVALIGGEPVWFAPAVREVVALETALENASIELTELRSLRDGILMLKGDPAAKQTFVQLVQEAGLENTASLRATLNQLNSPNPFGKELAETERYIASAQKMVVKARAKFNDLLLIENASAPALLKIAKQDASAATKEAEKAKAELETARQEVADAAAETKKDTTQADKDAYAASIQAGREGLDLPGVRVAEDTVALRKKITGLRSEITTASVAIKKEKDPVKKAALQEELAAAEAKLANVDIKTPRRITEIKTAEEIAFDQQAETTAAAQARAVARERAEAAAAAAGEVSVAPRLPATQKGAVAYGKNNQVTQTGAPSATAQMGSTGVVSIEALTAKKAELVEVQRQQTYLRTNNKDKVKGRFTKTMQGLNIEEVKLQKEIVKINQTLAAVKREKGDTANEIGRYQGSGSLPKDASLSRGVEGYSRNLSPTQIDLVANNELEGALTDIANDKGSDALNKAVARRLSLLLDDTSSTVQDTIVDSKGEEAIGMFYKKAVYLSRNGGLNQEALLHEGTHAGADRVIDMYDEDPSQLTDTQRAAIRELTAIHERIKTDPGVTSVNAKTTLKEFVAEVMSNQRLQEQLKERSWRLSDMLRAFKSVILRAIGIDPKTVDNMLDASILAIDNIFTPSSQQVGSAATPSFAKTQSVFIGSSPDALTTFRGNFLGLAGRVQYVDAKAAREAAFAAAEKAGKLTNNELFQANYFMRMADKVSQAVGQFLSYGPISIVRDPKTGEYGYGRKAGATMVRVAELVEKSGVEDGEMMLTRIAAGQRADAVPNGWERLAGKKAAEAKVEYENAVAYLKTNPTAKKYMDAALLEYKQFNSGLLDFAEQHDLLSAEEVARLKKTPFVPFYRVEDGVVKLYSDSESAIRIGDISNDPELVRMLGSEQTILPIFTSAVQNTYMLTRLSMHNKESLESSNALFKAGFVSKMGKGQGLASKDTVHYRLKGEPHFATIDSDTFGIPANLIVAGMSGIKTTIPILVRAMGYPADLVRKFVTRAPVYPFRQLVRDPINAAILSGVDGVPVLNALKELGKMRMGTSTSEEALSGGLVVSSNVFSGNERDMQQFIESIATGKNWWKKTMGALDTFALQTDAATRATVYQDGLKKGLSEFRAQLHAAESQNFGRHGLSPSMHYLSTLIPFFNSQVQGLDLLYRALKGKLPFSEQLELKRKLYARGVMLTVGVMAYAAMMQDDEAYKKATPQERYSNLFLPLPGLKEPLKIPIPYEVGVIFVALPQMIIDLVFRDTKAREALKGMGGVLAQSVPGVVPAAAKPVLEAFYGSTTVGPIESEREKKLFAESRFKDTTPEALRIAGSVTGLAGVSPIMLTHLVRGYTGGLGVALLQVFDPLLGAGGTGEKASVPLNKQPLIGGLFQSAEGRGFIDAAYDHMERIQQARQTYVSMVEREQRAEAAAFAQRYANELAAAAVSGQTFKRLGDLYSMERKIRAHPTMTTAQKDNMIDRIKVEQNRIAVSFERLTDRTTRP